MKELNKKAAECTAIHPTAKKYNLCESAKIIGISADDFTGFYLLRQYIKKEPYGYSATALGIEKGCFVNDKNYNALVTEKAICRVAKVFAEWNKNTNEGKNLIIAKYGSVDNLINLAKNKIM